MHPGHVAVARHPEHGYVVKRVHRRGEGALSLVSLNEAYPPLELGLGQGRCSVRSYSAGAAHAAWRNPDLPPAVVRASSAPGRKARATP